MFVITHNDARNSVQMIKLLEQFLKNLVQTFGLKPAFIEKEKWKLRTSKNLAFTHIVSSVVLQVPLVGEICVGP